MTRRQLSWRWREYQPKATTPAVPDASKTFSLRENGAAINIMLHAADLTQPGNRFSPLCSHNEYYPGGPFQCIDC